MIHKRHSRRHGRRHKGGAGEPYSSAASYGEYVNNSENSQYNRVFSETGPYSSVPGNTIIGAQGQNSHWPGVPNSQQLSLIQKAGKRGSRKRSGGLWGSVINQAIVPFSLLAMQQTYRRKRQGGKKRTRKHRKHRKH
jgi:hypothetical protein